MRDSSVSLPQRRPPGTPRRRGNCSASGQLRSIHDLVMGQAGAAPRAPGLPDQGRAGSRYRGRGRGCRCRSCSLSTGMSPHTGSHDRRDHDQARKQPPVLVSCPECGHDDLYRPAATPVHCTRCGHSVRVSDRIPKPFPACSELADLAGTGYSAAGNPPPHTITGRLPPPLDDEAWYYAPSWQRVTGIPPHGIATSSLLACGRIAGNTEHATAVRGPRGVAIPRGIFCCDGCLDALSRPIDPPDLGSVITICAPSTLTYLPAAAG